MLTRFPLPVHCRGTIDFGAGNEKFTLSVGATQTSILGGAGNDTFVVSARIATSSTIAGGDGNDQFPSLVIFLEAPSLVVLVKTHSISQLVLTTRC